MKKQVKRGDIFLIAFDPTKGSEIQKTRPAIVIQNDIGNKYSATTVVAAITSQAEGNHYPGTVLIQEGEGGLKKESLVLLNQIRTVDIEKRCLQRLGKVTLSTLRGIDQALQLQLCLINL